MDKFKGVIQLMSNDSLDDLIKAMLDANQKNKAQKDQSKEEQKSREDERKALLQAIKYQKEHLINRLNNVVEKFNQQTVPNEKITVSQKDIAEGRAIYQTVLYTLPNKLKGINLVFFSLDPALNLTYANHGFVPLGAYLKGQIIKFLWCRDNGNDRLGKWISCKIPTSELHPTDIRSYEEEYRFTEKMLRSLEGPITNTALTVQYEDDVPREFARVLLAAMQS
jgi:hypothetical protein